MGMMRGKVVILKKNLKNTSTLIRNIAYMYKSTDKDTTGIIKTIYNGR